MNEFGHDPYLRRLDQREFFGAFEWDEWLAIPQPYPYVDFSTTDVTSRFHRNGYDWDIHGLLYTPVHEVDPSLAIVIIPGGAGSSRGKDSTPDGRPGIARHLAGQGFKVLSLDYVGLYPPGGIWTIPIADRQPHYLLDQDLSLEETLDRNLKCTFNVELQGAGQIVDENLAGRKILAFGHSTGGPMISDLYRWSKQSTVVGIIGFGSGGPHCWRAEWVGRTNQPYREMGMHDISRRSLESFRTFGYEGVPELTPWGNAEGFMNWAYYARPQFKTGLCDNTMLGAIAALERTAKHTGLPTEEYIGYLEEQDPDHLSTLGVVRLCSENDRQHWTIGETLEDKYDVFWGRKYAEHTSRVHVAYVPKYSHYGMMELHNEKIAYTWLWAFRQGFFEE